eukprot:Gb_24840 [translate_table: standard]
MDGGSLVDIVRENKFIPEPILSVITQILLHGLKFLHGVRHLVHRDRDVLKTRKGHQVAVISDSAEQFEEGVCCIGEAKCVQVANLIRVQKVGEPREPSQCKVGEIVTDSEEQSILHPNAMEKST